MADADRSGLITLMAEVIHERWLSSMYCYHEGAYKRCEKDAEAMTEVILANPDVVLRALTRQQLLRAAYPDLADALQRTKS